MGWDGLETGEGWSGGMGQYGWDGMGQYGWDVVGGDDNTSG